MNGGEIDIVSISVQLVQLPYKPRHPADVYATWADISKAERLLGWRPQASCREGIARLVSWYQANQEWASQIEV